MARTLLALALCGSAAAYVAPTAPAKAASALNSKAELEALAEARPRRRGLSLRAPLPLFSRERVAAVRLVFFQTHHAVRFASQANGDFLGSTIGFWDPLGVTNLNFWGLGEEGTIGYLRHAEIKHGRVAMAGFLGFCVQSTPLVAGEHTLPFRYRGENGLFPTPPYRGFVPDVSPQEQWDNIPLIGKLQILTFVGMLESYGEGAGSPDGYVHYTKGGLPGYYPPIVGGGGGQITLNLYKPFDIFPEQDEAEKTRGRQVEINNGRLAMLGIISLLTESNGLIVPPLDGIESFPKYAGNVMIPFSNDFSLY